MSNEPRMKDIPLHDGDRKILNGEFEGFDEMTLEDFRKAKDARVDELLELLYTMKDD